MLKIVSHDTFGVLSWFCIYTLCTLIPCLLSFKLNNCSVLVTMTVKSCLLRLGLQINCKITRYIYINIRIKYKASSKEQSLQKAFSKCRELDRI